MATKILVNNGSDNGLLFDGVKRDGLPIFSSQHWFRQWLHSSHYLNQCWLENIGSPSQCNFTEDVQNIIGSSRTIPWLGSGKICFGGFVICEGLKKFFTNVSLVKVPVEILAAQNPIWRPAVILKITISKVWPTMLYEFLSLRWRHNEHDSISNHQPYDCLLNGLFRRRSKKTSKLRVTGLCMGN